MNDWDNPWSAYISNSPRWARYVSLLNQTKLKSMPPHTMLALQSPPQFSNTSILSHFFCPIYFCQNILTKICFNKRIFWSKLYWINMFLTIILFNNDFFYQKMFLDLKFLNQNVVGLWARHTSSSVWFF